MRFFISKFIVVVFLMVTALFSAQDAWAASCCGGGSAGSLVLPKFSKSMVDISFDWEKYDGFWDQEGNHTPDPPGSDLNQYRLNLGYAKRLGSRWQGSIQVPYVWNENKYSGVSASTEGLGDVTLNLLYETFDMVMCVWKVRKLSDLKPAVYFGASLTLPTGISPYDDVGSSFNITGRGFYKLDGTMLLEKSVWPWSLSFLYTYGIYFERPVNREYGKYVEPYHKKLGDRRLGTLSLGYTHFLESMRSITVSAAYSDLLENEGTIDGNRDPATGIRKRSISWTFALASSDRNWVGKFIWNKSIKEDGWGENFPTTDIFTVGVSRVFR